MTRISGLLEVNASHFLLAESAALMQYRARPDTDGLTLAYGDFVAVLTGIHMGMIFCSVEVLEQAPPSVELDDWQCVVEVSCRYAEGNARVRSFVDMGPDFPVFTATGPGWYRLRVHARGRDLHYDQVGWEPTEHYLVLVWPSIEAAAITYKLTDEIGVAWAANGPN